MITIAAAALAGACGGKAGAPGTVGSHAGGGAARGPAMIFVGIGDGMVFEGACHACDALRARLEGQVVSSGEATFRITGTVSDQCDASGPTDVLGVERLTGDPERAPLGVAVLPAGAPVDLVTYATDRLDTGAGALVPALQARAQADLADGGDPITADAIVIEQVIEVNVTGDARPEKLIAANVPQSEDEGPGYRWSALVMAPDGDVDHLVTLWQSTLEHLTIDASYDLEGDGVRALVYSAEYYEGAGRGTATVTNDKLDLIASWGCGA